MKTTLFMIMSLDGKISTGSTDNMDIDKDFPKLEGNIASGLNQYYEIEQTTSNWSLTTGRTKAKLGVNTEEFKDKVAVNHILVDSHNLTEHGIQYMSHLAQKLFIVTNNREYLKYNNVENIQVRFFERDIDFKAFFEELELHYGCKELTIQSGGTLNSVLIRQGLIDYIDIVVAPIIIGGNRTSTLIDGQSFEHFTQMYENIRQVELISVKKLDYSYLRLKYKVLNN